jgi:hypothetical protein
VISIVQGSLRDTQSKQNESQKAGPFGASHNRFLILDKNNGSYCYQNNVNPGPSSSKPVGHVVILQGGSGSVAGSIEI